MTASYELTMKLKGTTEELYAMLLVLKKYAEGKGETCAYFNDVEMSYDDETFDIDEANEEELREFVEFYDEDIMVSGFGPYGHYRELNDVGLFQEIAEAAPNASFEGKIEGFGQYDEQTLECILEDGKLYISTWFQSNEYAEDVYAERVAEKLTYKKFIKWFGIDPEEFEEDDYIELIKDYFRFSEEDISSFSFEKWEEIFEENDIEFSLEEDKFERVREKIDALDLKSFYNMQDDDEFGTKNQMVYDPIEGKYIEGLRERFPLFFSFDE